MAAWLETAGMMGSDEHVSDRVEAELLEFELTRERRRDIADVPSIPDAPPPGDVDLPPPRPRQDPNDPRPEILIHAEQAAVVDAAEDALRRAGGMYVRGLRLVRVIRDKGSSDWLKRPDGTPVIYALSRDGLLEHLGRAAVWLGSRKTKKGVEIARTVPPPWAATMLLDGTIHDEPGYDPRTRVIYDPRGVTFPPVPAAPTHAQATRALADLLDPFAEFPFVGDTDRAAVAALILSVIGRAAIDGPVPMFASQAPTPGSGKGLLVDAAATIATGRKAPLMPPTDDEDETRKRLMAIALESPSMVVIDNVEGTLGSATLAMALTAGEIRDRRLGTNENVTASLRPVWCFTGNNVQLKGDVGRRVAPIDLDPKVEHPEDRTFHRANLIGYVEKHRPRLAVAALTVLRAFVVAGHPDHGLTVKGSFEAWDRLVRGAVIWAGGVDPLGGVQRIREQSDDDLERIRALLVSWHASV
ncbi:MAG: hypothetical protein E6J91_19815, partial [Deltaproteobacteria bacterium]